MKFFYLVLAVFLFSLCGTRVYGQSLENLFGKDNLKKVADAVAGQLDITPKKISGQWEYSGMAVSLGGDNKLANAASDLALGSIEEKLGEYLAKAGIAEGSFSYTFNDDGSFATNYKKLKLPGKYTFSTEDKSLELDYGMNEKFRGVAMHAQVSVTASGMELLFSADKILDFIGKITSSVGDSKLGELDNLIKKYDSLKVGFKLVRSAE